VKWSNQGGAMSEGAMTFQNLTQMVKTSKNTNEKFKQQKEMKQITFGKVK